MTSDASAGRLRGSPRRAAGIAGAIVLLVTVLLVFFGPGLVRRFEEPPVVDVCDILRGEVEGDVVMVRGVVQRESAGQGYVFLGDVEEVDEIVVGGISMLPVVRVQSWAWFTTGQEVRLPVRITEDPEGGLLLVEVGGGGRGLRRTGHGRGVPADSSEAGPSGPRPGGGDMRRPG